MLVRWGICGCGMISHDFAATLSLLPADQHQVTGVAARSLERAETFRSSLPRGKEATAYSSYAALFNAPDVDVVYVATLNHQHKDAVLGALKAGKHVVCEKPLAMKKAEVEEVVECAKKQQRFLLEGHWTRFFPAMRKIKEIIKSGEEGAPQVVMGSFGLKFDKVMNKRVLDKELGGGVGMDIGCYLLSVAMHVFDHPKVEKISVVGRTFEGSDVDDTAFITLQLEGGRYAQLNYSGTVNYPNSFSIFFDKKGDYPMQRREIHLPPLLWCPLEFQKKGVKVGGDKITVTETSESFKFPLPEGAEDVKINYLRSQGLAYEASAVRDCLMQGKLECPEMTHQHSLQLIELMDEVRKQIGSYGWE